MFLNIEQKMNFSIKNFFIKCDQTALRIWSNLLEKSLMQNFFFYAVIISLKNALSKTLQTVSNDFHFIYVLKIIQLL